MCHAQRALPRRPGSLHITFKQLLFSISATSTLSLLVLPSLAVSLFSILPEALALNQPSFYCLFFFNMLAFEKWTLSLTHKKTTAFIFS